MKRLAVSVILVWGLSGAAYADVLFTPSLPAIYATNEVHCSIVNVDGRTRDVVIEALNPGGAVVGTSGQIRLAPGNVAVVAVPGNLTPVHCRFEVEGHGKKFRAGIAVLHPDVGMISALPAE